MPQFYLSGEVYCTLCDRYFPCTEARAQHVQFSENHPGCVSCNRRFSNKHSLRQHYLRSRRHHYCFVCDRDFTTEGGLKVHVEFASVHRDDSDDEDLDDEAPWAHLEETPGWEDLVASTLYPEEAQVADDDFDVSDEDYDEDVDYWEEDDEGDSEEDEETYNDYEHMHPSLIPTRWAPDYLSTETVRDVLSQAGSDATTNEHNSDCCSTSLGVNRHPQEKSPTGIAFMCPLCLEAPKESSATRCGHLFCTPCINRALDVKKSCPVCRQPAVSPHLRKIYLAAN